MADDSKHVYFTIHMYPYIFNCNSESYNPFLVDCMYFLSHIGQNDIQKITLNLVFASIHLS